MHVVHGDVHPALAPFVESIGYGSADLRHGTERVLPTGGAQLIVNLDADVMSSRHHGAEERIGGAGLVGVTSTHADVDPAHQRETVWVAFRPGGAYPFLPTPVGEATDLLVDLDAVWGRAGRGLRERLLDAPTVEAKLRVTNQALLDAASGPLEPDPAVRHAVRALSEGAAVGSVVDDLGTTPKRLIRTFTEQVGVPPKRFARIRRFQRLLSAIPYDRPVDWAALAVTCGYADQAHLIHEFKALAGLRPTEYRARGATEQNHVPLAG